MNRQELAKKISDKFYLRLGVSEKILDHICSEIIKQLRAGDRVYLQKLGAFRSVIRKARRYYDPRTGNVKTKPAHKDVIFQPSKQLLRQIARAKKP